MNKRKALRRMFDNYINKALKSDNRNKRETDTAGRWLSSIVTREEFEALEAARGIYHAGNKKEGKKAFEASCKTVRVRLFVNNNHD